MGTSVSLNSVSYTIPLTGEDDWGVSTSNYLIALATGVLSKAGGSFTLTAEVDFGASYGVKSAYYKSRGTASSTGIMRLANAETVSWRNAANSADLPLTVNSSNVLNYNSNPILTLALGSAYHSLKMNAGGTAYEWGSIVNANVDASAAITYSKLSLSDSILNADINSAAAIAYSKLNLGTSIVNADISGSAAIAYSKLSLGTSIVNADISASAAIAYSKLSLGTSIVNADISASAAIAYSKLNLGTSIVNADVNASAAIAYSKLALTGSVLFADMASSAVVDEDNMVSDSAVKLPTQQSVKAYVDTSITAVTGGAHSPEDRNNYTINASVGSSALTVALKTRAGSDPSAGSPVTVGFRNSTLATGDYSTVTATAATSVVVPSGATMGWTSGDTRYVYVYALNNSGTLELAVASQMMNESALHTTTAVDTSSDSASGKYSTTARTSVAVRYLGKVLMTQATAGTWASSPTEISTINQPRSAIAMDDSEATRLGLKFYAHNVNYNNGLGPDISGPAGIAVVNSSFMPYQLQDGSWRMRFNFDITVSPTATVHDCTIVGVTFDGDQAIYGYAGSSVDIRSQVNGSAGTMIQRLSSTTTASRWAGDVALASKPTWAY